MIAHSFHPSTLMDSKARLLLVRGAVLFYFCLEGSLIGLWTAFVPHVQDHLNISDTLLGSAILFFYLGTVLGSPLTGLSLHHFGAQTSTGVGAILYSTFLPVVAQADSFPTLCIVYFIWGMTEALLDVSMNTSGVIAEVQAGYPIVGFFHGSYSISAAIGGVIGSALLSRGYDDTNVYLVAMSIAVLFIAASYYIYYDWKEEKEIMKVMDAAVDGGTTSIIERGDSKSSVGSSRDRILSNSSDANNKSSNNDKNDDNGNDDNGSEDDDAWHPLVWRDRESICDTDPESSLHTLNTSPLKSASASEGGPYSTRDILDLLMVPRSVDLFVLSSVGFMAAFGECIMTSWAIIYYKRTFPNYGASRQGVGFALFEVFMGVGRYSIDISRRYLGPKRMVFVAGLLTVAGLALVSLGPSFSSLAERESEDPGGPGCGAYIAISMGFAVVGLGLSTTLPIAFILAGYLTDSSTGRNMSVVSTWTNSGNIISPVLVGAISDAISLRLAMGLAGMCEVMLLVLSFRVPDDKYQRSDRSGGKKEEEDGYVTLEGDGNDTLQTPLL